MRAFLLLFVLACAHSAAADESVRIAVGRFPSAVIAGSGVKGIAVDGSEMSLANKTTFTAGASGLVVDGKPIASASLRVRTKGLLTLQGHSYRQELLVQWRLYDKKPELLVVHPLDLETYVAGIVSSELPKNWSLDAYKAQAVASRTFALWQKYRRLDLPYHLESSVLDQVYAGVEREHALAHQAVVETKGEVLSFSHHLVQAYFHAACGDRTESALEGWGSEIAYLPGSACHACSAAPRAHWAVKLPRAQVNMALSKVLGEAPKSITVVEKTATGRAKVVELVGAKKKKRISGPDLRRLLGYQAIWSTWVTRIAWEGNNLVVEGNGSGHGVGMCQWGAEGMAESGTRYDKILSTYYPGAALKRLY